MINKARKVANTRKVSDKLFNHGCNRLKKLEDFCKTKYFPTKFQKF